MLNEIAHQTSNVHSWATGCTSKSVLLDPIEEGGISYRFIDTPGLYERNEGTITSGQAILDILDMIRSLQGALHLLIFVTRIGTLHQSTKDCYDLFANLLFENRIPAICVITGCENEDPMSVWASKNEQLFHENGMRFKILISTCFAKDGPFEIAYKPLREESTRNVWHAIRQYSLQQPITVLNMSDAYQQVITQSCRALHFDDVCSVGLTKLLSRATRTETDKHMDHVSPQY
ncbi:unnamed protein product [Didymodactylos carnosus]|uniref:G domain-containing protein n=1 Tax=Didymodactylos carnosus TaxID=1234261 RepID=A0A816CPF1_9BILA|nr:unnamed protein product [Didymodactylos carnosus]CAF1626004.1 unnamed protein product [Didymodactylos carnosus]CAF4388452.1 unnamed protein product [Didymodactylos carnosus]CAF4519919.1 unnamed protein product [Didymodactylos carnosus]